MLLTLVCIVAHAGERVRRVGTRPGTLHHSAFPVIKFRHSFDVCHGVVQSATKDIDRLGVEEMAKCVGIFATSTPKSILPFAFARAPPYDTSDCYQGAQSAKGLGLLPVQSVKRKCNV